MSTGVGTSWTTPSGTWRTARRMSRPETVIEGEMPPGYFTLWPLNSSASLSDSEKAELVTGLLATFGGEGGGDGRRDRDRDERDDDD